MVDRIEVYPGELPRSADILTSEKNMLYGIGYLAQAILGAGPQVQGLAAAPTAPASLSITIGSGSIYNSEIVDATAFAGLGTDSNIIVKQGLLLTPQTLAITPPTTSGFSQVYLVEVAYVDQDSGATVLPYFNSTNPSVPFSGPANAGTSNFTLRQGICNVALKAGIAAATGTQAVPAADPGFSPLYAITVVNGQTAVTSANIAQVPGAPFIPVTLPQVPAAVQASDWTFGGVSTGTTAAFELTLDPTPEALTLGMRVYGEMNAAPAANATLQINVPGSGPGTITRRGGGALEGGEWAAGDMMGFIFNAGSWQVIGLTKSDVTGLTAGTAPIPGEGISVSGQEVSLNFSGLTQENTVGANDLVAFFAEEAEGGEPGGHHYQTTVGNFFQLASSLFAVPSGAIFYFPAVTPPAGYLVANGAAISRTGQPGLFNVMTVATTATTTSGTNTLINVAADLVGIVAVGFPVEGVGIPAGTTITGVAATTLTLSNDCTATASSVAIRIFPFGNGDGATTLNLPDLLGEFIRGWDNGRGIDPNRVLGTNQADQFQGHIHPASSQSSTSQLGAASELNVSISNGSDNIPQGGEGISITTTTTIGDPTNDGTNGAPRFGLETRPTNVALLPCIKT
jgi:hypothetical protein